MEKQKISIIGLGKLGSSMVGAFASKGYKVIGVDINPDSVRLMNQGKPPVFEPKLAEYLTAICTDYPDLVRDMLYKDFHYAKIC